MLKLPDWIYATIFKYKITESLKINKYKKEHKKRKKRWRNWKTYTK